MHWKYIKREKKNGKWRYYYHDDDYEKAKTNYERAQQVEEYERKRLHSTIEKNNAIIDEINKSFNDKYGDQAGNHWVEFSNTAAPYTQEKIEAKTRHKEALNRTIDAMYAYSKAEKTYKQSAGHKVADFLNKTSDAANEAKKWVGDLFSGSSSKRKTTKSNSSENVIKENVIKENIIKENVITEQFVDAYGNPVTKRKKP
jgi:hypothetical protein